MEPIEVPHTGFLLRSRIVGDYPGLGVNVYPAGHTPDDPEPLPLTILRLDRFGDTSDTLLCIVDGEAQRVDVHEAPELLHYGIDTYAPPSGSAGPTATKQLHTFTRSADGTVVLSKQTSQIEIGASFRSRSPRVVKLAALAGQIATANPGGAAIDSAEMGFEMTEGVGMVSFVRRAPA